MGVVICKPFGYEAVCSHRSLRSFAEAAAAAGMPTLRFDYLGTGDSPDIDPQADQVETWTSDVLAAVDELQRQTGVARLCLLGFRLGALLAALAARRCKAVSALVLVSPVITGRRYVREMRTTRLAASMGGHLNLAEGESVAAPSDGSMEVGGFAFSAATLASLAEIDLKASSAPAADLLIIDGTSMPVARAWASQLQEAHARVDYVALPGLIEMLMAAPQVAVVPKEMIGATCEWLGRLADARAPQGLASAVAPGPHSLQLADGLVERPVLFGDDGALFGIVTEPRPMESRRRAVIMLNAGADFHIGASGIYVGLARYWAGRGCVVLRMDFAGIGDSETRAGRPDEEVFPPAAVDDMRAAIDWLRLHYEICDITLFGLCSGAYHALRGAIAELPINRALLVNPQNYFWKQGMSITAMQVAELVSSVPRHRRSMFSFGIWKRLFSGQIDVGYVFKLYVGRALLTVESKLREVARRLQIHLPSDLGWELEKIAKRGVDVVFVFAVGEPGIGLLKMQGGSSIERLADRCRIHLIENADHVFSKSAPRAVLQRILSEELFGGKETVDRSGVRAGKNA